MFEMDLDTPVDRLEQELLAGERLIAEVRSRQAEILRRLDSVEAFRADGAASLQEWTRARLDVSDTTAADLVTAARTLAGEPRVVRLAATHHMSFDRLVATARLARSGADEVTLTRSLGFDLAGVGRLVNRRRRVTRLREEQTFRDRYLMLQPSLDGSQGRLYASLPGYEYTVVGRAILDRADRFNQLPGPRMARSQRMADALVAMAHDSLDTVDDAGIPNGPGEPVDATAAGDTAAGSGRGESLVTVFVDADLAGATQGEAGAEIAFGPRVGPNTLERILCTGKVQIIGLSEGRPVVTSHAARAIPPAVRRFVMWRDSACGVDGCASRYRLQVHHIQHRADGGNHDPSNLVTLCWFHHHVVIHGLGMCIDPDSPPNRRRLTHPNHSGPDPP